ncbi:kinase-like domain-containing protein [Limtongia smithiae]|uniref:kinase-like domain-containing protein n=1 Tax=Limtongia smithiae TaxID=1125753 RepID=UPI0034CDC8BE
MALAHYLFDIANVFTGCFTCLPAPALYINNRSYKIQRLLGEGGFAYVYLVQAENGELFALKKIRCPFGAESLQHAKNEIESYKIFNDEHIIHYVDSSVVQERDGSKTVYIVLPYFRQGNLQDTINANLINGNSFDEKDALDLFLEIAKGVRVLHHHRAHGLSSGPTRSTASSSTANLSIAATDTAEVQPLMDIPLSTTGTSAPSSDVVPYSHRDIKPANIMISQVGVPVLMDLGSCARARTVITSRRQALEVQDLAAEHCSMPYRAPELFDVKTNTVIDEKIDIWSLGCTFFALLYNNSPFEMQTAESGASLSLAVINGQYRIPDLPAYSEATKNIIRTCLTVEPKNRPDIDNIIVQITAARQQFP